MKPTALILAVVLFAVALFNLLSPRDAHAINPPPPETYLIVSLGRGQTDAQLTAQLNALASEGWQLRCSIPNGVIMVR